MFISNSPIPSIQYPISNIVALIGWPVEHSLSPVLHNHAFRQAGLDWHYVPLPVAPGQLAQAVRSLVTQQFAGANVTTPYKQAVIPYLDELAPEAQAIGAVNNLVVHHGRIIGHNTDAGGFLASLAEVGFDPAGATCAVLGAGGAARAVVWALNRAGALVHVYNRTPEHALELARPGVQVHSLAELPQVPSDTCLLVNATTLGFGLQKNLSPWPDGYPISARWLVYDLVYGPQPTPLLAAARSAGATAIDGLGMLVHQAAHSFELWTGLTLPVAVFWQAAGRVVGRIANSPYGKE